MLSRHLKLLNHIFNSPMYHNRPKAPVASTMAEACHDMGKTRCHNCKKITEVQIPNQNYDKKSFILIVLIPKSLRKIKPIPADAKIRIIHVKDMLNMPTNKLAILY